jgi:DNA gyrase/topoisomerase IV subunit B
MRKDKNVFDYTDDKITVNYDDRSRVRQSPQVYLPSTDLDGAIHLFEEAFANDIDEVLAPDSCGSEIIITFDEKTSVFTMQDDGRGLPHGKFFDLLEVLSSSGKMGTTNRAYNHSTGAFGMGFKLINFFSVYMKVRSERDGKFIDALYEDGLRKEVKEGKTKSSGTYVEWKVDKRFFTSVAITIDHILDKIKKKSLVAGGCTIIFSGKSKKGEEVTKTFKNGKLKDHLASFKVVQPIAEYKRQDGNSKIEFVFGYDLETDEGQEVIGFTNGSYNKIGGSHVNGLIEGFSTFMRKYMMESYLSDKEKKDLTEKDKKEMRILIDDVKAGLVGIVSIYALNPSYKGQYKEGLDDNNLKNFTFNSVRKYLRDLDKNTINKFAQIIKANIRARVAAENSKKRIRKDITNAFSPDKINEYLPISKFSTSKFREMCIVEGLSARGGFKAVRDKNQMAVLAIRGKVENIFDLTPAEAAKPANSKLVSNLVQIYEIENENIKNFDIEKFPFDRVNIVTDADSDGGEISCQLAMIYARFFPAIVTSGRLFKIIPPLYEVKVKGESVFISTVRDYAKYTQTSFMKAHKLFLNNKEIKSEDLLDFLVEFHTYQDNLQYLSNQYLLTPELTEFLISNLHVGFENHKIEIWNTNILPTKYRFLKARPGDNGYLEIEGMVGSEYNLFEFTDEFIEDTVERYKINPEAHFYGYTIDGKQMSLYEVMQTVSKYAPKIVTRFKGLGEMRSADLERTIVDKSARHSIRLTMKDIEDTYERMAVMHSKKKDYPNKRKIYMRNFKFDIMDVDT